ncbi:MAG: (2Fe-2S)-binding protein [Ilumatobacteraceae bacterium]
MSAFEVDLRVNGSRRQLDVKPEETLLDVLHDRMGMTDVRYGCGEGVCGTCTVLLDGDPVSACLLLAVQAAGRDITTLRGLEGSAPDGLHPLQRTMLQLGGSQCGFCTPGVILTAVSLGRRNPTASREEIRHELVGNLCRCTGYTKIVDAIESYFGELGAEANDVH